MITNRERQLRLDRRARVFDITAEVAPAHVDVNVARQKPVFVADHARAGGKADVRHLPERDLRARRSGNEHAAERIEVAAKATLVAHVHGIALAPLDGARDVLTTDRRLNHFFHIAHGQAVARCLFAVHSNVREVTLGDSLGIHRPRPGNSLHDGLDLLAELLDGCEVRA